MVKPEETIQLGKPRHRWEDNIERYFEASGVGGRGLDLSGSRLHVAGCCDYGNELSGSIKYGDFLHWMGNYKLPKWKSATWFYLLWLS